MIAELEERRFLYQEIVVRQILERFGDEHVYHNENGNLAISKKVLKEFRDRTPDVVWERGGRLWRKRERYDAGTGRQTD